MKDYSEESSDGFPDQEPKIEFVDLAEARRKENQDMRLMLAYNKDKILSLVIALFYLVFIALSQGGYDFFRTLIFLLSLPLPLIWFSEFFNGYAAASLSKKIDAPTPVIMLKIAGWFFLLSPFIHSIFIVIFLAS